MAKDFLNKSLFTDVTSRLVKFYLYVLLVALVLLAIYLLTTSITVMWLLCPCSGNTTLLAVMCIVQFILSGQLARFMRSYKSQLEDVANVQVKI